MQSRRQFLTTVAAMFAAPAAVYATGSALVGSFEEALEAAVESVGTPTHLIMSREMAMHLGYPSVVTDGVRGGYRDDGRAEIVRVSPAAFDEEFPHVKR